MVGYLVPDVLLQASLAPVHGVHLGGQELDAGVCTILADQVYVGPNSLLVLYEDNLTTNLGHSHVLTIKGHKKGDSFFIKCAEAMKYFFCPPAS